MDRPRLGKTDEKPSDVGRLRAKKRSGIVKTRGIGQTVKAKPPKE